MTESKDPRSGHVRIEAKLCHVCQTPFIGPRGCSASAYLEECVALPEPLKIDRDAPTMTSCFYCSDNPGRCSGCLGTGMVPTDVKSEQVAAPLSEAAKTKRKP